MKRSATANWKGSGKEGSGKLLTQSGVIKNKAYDYRSRFEDGTYTNPEELIAAAHAGCFTMKLSFNLNAAGFTADNLETVGTVTFENGVIAASHLDLTAKVPGIDKAKFDELVKDAELNCPISKSLNTSITVSSVLV